LSPKSSIDHFECGLRGLARLIQVNASELLDPRVGAFSERVQAGGEPRPVVVFGVGHSKFVTGRPIQFRQLSFGKKAR
jgi:hypothetical protein